MKMICKYKHRENLGDIDREFMHLPGNQEIAKLPSGLRATNPRKFLLNIICDYEGHFTASDLAERLRSLGHPISLVTVYRNLPILEQAGLIRRTCLTGPTARYERTWKRRHHDHLICVRCRKVVEFEYSAIDVLQDAVAAEHGFLPTDHHLELMGVCRECRAADKTSLPPRPGESP